MKRVLVTMVHHLPEMHNKNINYYSAQRLEKVNDFSNSDFFRSINKNKVFNADYH